MNENFLKLILMFIFSTCVQLGPEKIFRKQVLSIVGFQEVHIDAIDDYFFRSTVSRKLVSFKVLTMSFQVLKTELIKIWLSGWHFVKSKQTS